MRFGLALCRVYISIKGGFQPAVCARVCAVQPATVSFHIFYIGVSSWGACDAALRVCVLGVMCSQVPKWAWIGKTKNTFTFGLSDRESAVLSATGRVVAAELAALVASVLTPVLARRARHRFCCTPAVAV